MLSPDHPSPRSVDTLRPLSASGTRETSLNNGLSPPPKPLLSTYRISATSPLLNRSFPSPPGLSIFHLTLSTTRFLSLFFICSPLSLSLFVYTPLSPFFHTITSYLCLHLFVLVFPSHAYDLNFFCFWKFSRNSKEWNLTHSRPHTILFDTLYDPEDCARMISAREREAKRKACESHKIAK